MCFVHPLISTKGKQAAYYMAKGSQQMKKKSRSSIRPFSSSLPREECLLRRGRTVVQKGCWGQWPKGACACAKVHECGGVQREKGEACKGV